MSLLYPSKCVFCGQVVVSGKDICNKCVKEIPLISGKTCDRCGIETEYCRCKPGDFAFERNIGVFYYEKVARKLVLRLKFEKSPQLINFMADLMSDLISVKYNNITFDFITFVPMNSIKFMFRGFNQAELLANRISEVRNIPKRDVLSGKFSFLSQKYRKRKDRRRNVKGKYRVKNNVNDLKDKTVLLIDDVITTGSTISECAYLLKQKGAKRVLCATFAITCKK